MQLTQIVPLPLQPTTDRIKMETLTAKNVRVFLLPF
jgi:hypothetical protein